MIELDKIYCEDCLNGMQNIPDGKIDCVLIDPPYNTTSCKWDCDIDMQSLWKEWKRVAKDNAAIVIFGSEPFASKVRLSNLEWYRYDLYWVKERPVNFFQLKRRFGKTTENIMVFYQKQPTYNPQKIEHKGRKVTNKTTKSHNSVTSGVNKNNIALYQDNGLRYPTDILRINREKLGSTIHETQKPLELVRLLVRSFTNPGDVVLDCFNGSATTSIACIKENRRYIGFEKDKRIYDLSMKRLLEL